MPTGSPPSPTQPEHSSPQLIQALRRDDQGGARLSLRAEGFGEKESSATAQQHCPDLQVHGGNTPVGPVASAVQERQRFGRMSCKMGLQALSSGDRQGWSSGQGVQPLAGRPLSVFLAGPERPLVISLPQPEHAASLQNSACREPTAELGFITWRSWVEPGNGISPHD